MWWFVGLWKDQEFLKNVVAGGLFFALEAVLLVWLIPRVVERRREKRWEPARFDFARAMAGTMRWLVLVLKDRPKIGTPEENEFLRKMGTTPETMAQLAQTFSAALDPVLMALCSQAIKEATSLNASIAGLRLIHPGSVFVDRTTSAESVRNGYAALRGTISKMYEHLGFGDHDVGRQDADDFNKEVEKWRAEVEQAVNR